MQKHKKSSLKKEKLQKMQNKKSSLNQEKMLKKRKNKKQPKKSTAESVKMMEIADANEPSSEEEITERTLSPEEVKSSDKEMSRKKLKKGMLIQRSEASQSISEFNLNEVGKEKVKLNELIRSSQKMAGQMSVKKQLQNAKMLKSLSVPLSKPQQDKIKRTVAYEKVCNEVSKWDTIVQSNRSADQLIFPLKKPELRLESFETVAQNFVTKHPVEEAVTELLKKSENNLVKEKPLTDAEEKALQAMSLEEAKLRHNELMKHRALISYKEAKARRQNKMKSKRYHRILKREKLKKVMKEFEELQKTDAAAAIEKFLETDKLRILERMTLKHRNTGKWAKQQKLRAKYNPESRSILKEDILIGRQLKEKVSMNDGAIANLKAKSISSYASEVEEPDMSLVYNRGLIEEARNRRKDFKDTDYIVRLGEMNEVDKSPAISIELMNSSKSPVVTQLATVPLTHSVEEAGPFTPEKKLKSRTKSEVVKTQKRVTVEDEMDFSSEMNCLDSMIPDGITFGDEDLDDTVDGIISISEAFADEEFIAEFREEKKAFEKANRFDGIDLFLPGWGSWGGPGVKQSKRKMKKFFIKPKLPPTKKSTLGNVIINEDKDKKAAEHQVRHLPFPFSNIHQFQSYIRQPIGHTWNPQSSFQNLIAPKVVTKMGKIIDPIDVEDVVLEKKTKPKPIRKVKKKRQEQKAAF